MVRLRHADDDPVAAARREAAAILRRADAEADLLRQQGERELSEARARAFAITSDAHRRADQLLERAAQRTRTEADVALNEARQVLGRLIAATNHGADPSADTPLEVLLCDGCRATVRRAYSDPPLAQSAEPSLP